MKSNLSEAIISASYNMVEDNFQDYFSELKLSTENSFLEDLDDDTINYYFRKIMSNSVAYMIMKRCGLNPKDYFSVEDFREITNFNTIQSVSKLGMATSDIAENGLKEIYETNKDLTKIKITHLLIIKNKIIIKIMKMTSANKCKRLQMIII